MFHYIKRIKDKTLDQDETKIKLAAAAFIFLLIIALHPVIKASLAVGIQRRERSGGETLTLPPGQAKKTFESPAYLAEMPFNAIAPHWKEENAPEGSRKFYIRVSDDGKQWGRWIEVEVAGPIRDDDPNPNELFPEVPILAEGRYFQYRLDLNRGKNGDPAPKIKDLKITYISSKTPKLRSVLDDLKQTFSALAQGEGPTIVDRAGWGSPDPYGNLFKGTAQHWYPQYTPVTQFFLHHTVLDSSDPAAAVRAIWEYHTYTRGWGDIGYNYLIGQNGIIYEGRFGGDNVVAGHVYTYNSGSLGVALIGCFQSNASACAGSPPPSAAMMNSLTDLLAWKSSNYEINPNTTHTFCGSSSCLNLWTIAGHRDAGVTACPGNLAYDRLQTIRETTWNKKSGWNLSAKQLDFDWIFFSSYGTDKSVTLRFKNTGNSTWTNTGNRLLLKTANPSGRTSIFQGTGWIDSQTPAALNEVTVAPGEIGSFTFNLQSPSYAKDYYWESFKLALGDGTSLSQFFTVSVAAPLYRWEFLGVSHSKNSVSMSPGETQTIRLKAKNIGTATWYRDQSWPVRLGTWGPSRASSFYHSGWFNNIRPALLNEETVAPGGIGTFTFEVSAPLNQGWFYERFNLVAEGLTWFNYTGAGAYFYVTPPGFSWQFLGVGHSTNSVFMNPGEVQTINLKAKNTGTTTWYKDQSWPVRLGTWGPSRASVFWHGGWFNNIRPALLNESSVAPGEVGTFGFPVLARYAPGWHYERVNLVAEGLMWFNYPGAGFYINVLPGYRWEFLGVGHSTNSVFMSPGQTQTIRLKAKNVGSATWTRDGPWPVRLGTWGPSRASSFQNPGWFNNIRPATMVEATVAPGEVGTFVFGVTAPSTGGWYYERVNLVAEGLLWFNYTGAGAYFYVTP